MPTNDDPCSVDRLILTVEEAAEQLRIHRATVFDLIRRGQLQSISIGRRRLIPLRSLDDFIAQRVRVESEGAVR